MPQAEAVARVREKIAVVDDLESKFNEWNKVQNPLTKLEQDMKVRECTKMSILTCRRVASKYTRRHNCDPKFTKDELFAYLATLRDEGLKPATIQLNHAVLKAWWDLVALQHWPLKGRKVHNRVEQTITEPVTFTAAQVRQMIKLVKAYDGRVLMRRNTTCA
jgi:hypothetical protein